MKTGVRPFDPGPQPPRRGLPSSSDRQPVKRFESSPAQHGALSIMPASYGALTSGLQAAMPLEVPCCTFGVPRSQVSTEPAGRDNSATKFHSREEFTSCDFILRRLLLVPNQQKPAGKAAG